MDLVDDHLKRRRMDEIDVDVPCPKLAMAMLAWFAALVTGLGILALTFVLS